MSTDAQQAACEVPMSKHTHMRTHTQTVATATAAAAATTAAAVAAVCWFRCSFVSWCLLSVQREGPEDSPFEGGTFLLDIQIPASYVCLQWSPFSVFCARACVCVCVSIRYLQRASVELCHDASPCQ